MTMQVGMVGTDGVLIASDTKWVERPKSRAVWDSYDASKFIVSDEKKIAISCAGSLETATVLAERTLAADDWLSRYHTIGDEALAGARTGREDAQCFIASAHPSPQLFSLQLVRMGNDDVWGTVARQIQTYKIAGDSQNPAIFWAQRYYRERLPIAKLIPLAAHLVLVAHKLNTAGIGGLEIVLCDATGIRFVPKEEIFKLKLEFSEREEAIVNLLSLA